MRTLVICWILALAATVTAQQESTAPAEPTDSIAGTSGLPEPWGSRFEGVVRELVDGDFERAERSSMGLVRAMAELFPASRDSRVLVAAALTLHAIAEVGAGHRDDAVWHWQVAQNLNPQLQRIEMPEVYGDNGAWLAAHRLRGAGTLPEGMARGGEEATPPLPMEVPYPEVPQRLEDMWNEDQLELEIVIDAEGRVRSPVVLEGGELPGKVYFALETIRQWRFRPAISSGRSVAALYELDRDFSSDRFTFSVARDLELGPVQTMLFEERFDDAAAAAWDEMTTTLACRRDYWSCDPSRALLLRALAQAGLGHEEDAAWSWHQLASFSIDPEVLGEYPVALRRHLRQNPPHCTDGFVSGADRQGCSALVLAEHPEVKAPRAVTAPPVKLPPALAERIEGDRLVAAIVVDAMGRVREPRMLAGHSVAAGYLALETLRQWQFEPASSDGQSVDVVLEVSIPLAPDVTEETAGRWRRAMDDLDDRLRDGDWEGVYGETKGLVAEVAGGVGAGGSDLLARALMQLALAEAGIGHDDDAVWHWHMAQNFAVELRYADLEPYPGAGEILARHQLRSASEVAEPPPEAPRKIAAPPPRFPKGVPDTADVAAIELIVDGSGRPRAPLVLRGRSTGRLYAALEALRDWRYEPPAEGHATPHIESLLLAKKLRPDELELEPGADTLFKLALKKLRSEPALASCYFYAARDLEPVLAAVDLRSHGQAAEALTEITPPRDRWSALVRPQKQKSKKEEGPIYVGRDVEPPEKIRADSPKYTKKTRKNRIQGVVIVQAIIDEQGYISYPKVLKSLHPELDLEAVKALCTWRFKPAKLHGEPVPVYYNLSMNFRLGEQ